MKKLFILVSFLGFFLNQALVIGQGIAINTKNTPPVRSVIPDVQTTSKLLLSIILSF